MKLKMSPGVGKAAACVAAVGIIATGTPAEAAASPTRTQHYWDDCAETYCTRYFSVERSESLFEDTQTTEWALWRALPDLSLLSSVLAHKSQFGLDGLEAAANDAVHEGGCLQFQWRLDGKSRGTWGSTTHSGYCFVESYTDTEGNVWQYDPDSNTYSAGF